jgi:hypothetical protein
MSAASCISLSPTFPARQARMYAATSARRRAAFNAMR